MTPAEWKVEYAWRKAVADMDRARLREAADAASRRAGLGELNGGILHNALVGESRGMPWRGIDYAEAREAARLLDLSLEPGRALSAWAAETLRQTTVAGCAECGDALGFNGVRGVCAPCIADATEVGSGESRAQVAARVASLPR